jgi:hypothetical protein
MSSMGMLRPPRYRSLSIAVVLLRCRGVTTTMRTSVTGSNQPVVPLIAPQGPFPRNRFYF